MVIIEKTKESITIFCLVYLRSLCPCEEDFEHCLKNNQPGFWRFVEDKIMGKVNDNFKVRHTQKNAALGLSSINVLCQNS